MAAIVPIVPPEENDIPGARFGVPVFKRILPPPTVSPVPAVSVIELPNTKLPPVARRSMTPTVPPPMMVIPGERFTVLLTNRVVPPAVRDPEARNVPTVSVVMPLPSPTMIGSCTE